MRTIRLDEMASLVGEELGVSDWMEISQARVNEFADATNDHQWIHCDVERANREMGGTIAHGYLTVSLIPYLGKQAYGIEGVARSLNYGSDKVRFLNPVKTGKRVRLRAKLIGAEARSGGMQQRTECTIEIEGEAKSACIAETIVLHFPA